MTAIPPIEPRDPILRANAQGLARVDVQGATLVVTFQRTIRLPDQQYLLVPRSYSLTGGQRLFPRVQRVEQIGPAQVRLLLDGEGDFSIYTLAVNGLDIDPFFASVKLRFRLACDDPFDFRAPPPPAPAETSSVTIDYLARDYASFRQALLDFVSTRMPAWVERSEADIGMMLLELFAAAADQLSYMQDRVANEAFLSSATQRRSVAGHLALIGYEMDEGAAAFTWLHFAVTGASTLPTEPGLQVGTSPRRPDEPPIIFETMVPATLRPEHNAMELYNWGNPDACLPQSALSAALVGSFEHLRAGDYLLFDDGPDQRDVVRLAARPEIVPPDPIRAHPARPLTLIRWLPALPLSGDYCIRTTTVRGNLALASHGETIAAPEVLRELSPEEKAAVRAAAAARTAGQRVPRVRLRLARGPLAYLDAETLALAAPLTRSTGAPAAADAFGIPVAHSVSTLSIEVEGIARRWQPRRTLLDSRQDDLVFRVELDDQGDATVVFGDNLFGRRPDDTARITATYRVGGGTIGNVAADTLVLARPRSNETIDWLATVTNPLPARGGHDPETRDYARRFGPSGFTQPLVAVTPGDYQAIAQSFTDSEGQPALQRASAAFRWTGSWLTATLAIDPLSQDRLDPGLRRDLLAFLETQRLAGYDLEIIRALYVPVDLAIEFCAVRGFRDADVRQELEQVLGSGDLPDGRRGFFHPDNFTFGDSLYISRLYAAIMAVPGVESAQIARLARLRASRPDLETAANLRQGYLRVGSDQIIRLDNDRNFPENGVLRVSGA